jgi:DNA-binding transcriptional LysR family regulator
LYQGNLIAGVGVTRLISYQVAEAVARGALQIILAQYEPAPMPVSMLHAGQRILPLKVRSFLDFAAPRLRAAMADERLNPGREAR